VRPSWFSGPAAAYLLASAIQPMVGLLVLVTAARYVSPAEFGRWNGVLLVVTYVSIISLGAFNGLNRNVAICRGRGATDEVRELVMAGSWVANAVALAGPILGVPLAIALLDLEVADAPQWMLVGCLALLLAMLPYRTQYDVLMSSQYRFALLGRLMLFEAALQLVLLPVIALFGTIGLYAHYIGTRMLALGARMATTPFGVRPRYLPKRVKELVVTGFPIMLSGYTFGVFQVADKTYVALKLTPAELGLYSVGNLVFLGVSTLPLAIAAMDYSRMAKAFGESEDRRRLIPFVTQGIAKAMVLAAAVAVPTYILLEPAVTFGLPKYASAIPTIKVMLATSVVSAAFICGNVFAVLRRSMEYNLHLVLAIAGTVLGCWVADRMGLGLVGIAAAKLGVTVIAVTAVALRAYALLRKDPSTG